MLNRSAAISLALGLLAMASSDQAYAGAKLQPASPVPNSSSYLAPDIGSVGGVAVGPSTVGKACRKFLPNVGLDMLVPCDEPSVATAKTEPPPTASLQPEASPPQRSQPTAARSERAQRKVSRLECENILERMQLDGARDDDSSRLRQGCR